MKDKEKNNHMEMMKRRLLQDVGEKLFIEWAEEHDGRFPTQEEIERDIEPKLKVLR